jgi:small subunit ribosomal protein S19|tara:strand:- start:761 stop:1027 length:267 start_codon:yes stop_codon:yes gene_type:complete
MGRSNWKGNFITRSLLKNVPKDVRIWCRNSTIPLSLVGMSIFVHDGKSFRKVLITREKVGFKLGDFAPTRKCVLKQKAAKGKVSKKKK